jgi:hypothetical protein
MWQLSQSPLDRRAYVTTFLAVGVRQRRRLVRLGLVLYAGAVLLFVGSTRDALGTAAGDDVASSARAPVASQSAPSVAPTAIPIDGGPRVDLPDLSDEQATRAVKLATTNPYLKAFLRGTKAEVSRIGPWTTFADPAAQPAARLIGASIVLKTSSPLNGDGILLPRARYDRTEQLSPPYRERIEPARKTGITELMILVDLGRSKVVDITLLPPPPPAG